MDKELFIRARKQDNELVEKAAREAAAEFQKTAGFPVETEIDSESPLPPDRLDPIPTPLIIVLEASFYWETEVKLN